MKIIKSDEVAGVKFLSMKAGKVYKSSTSGDIYIGASNNYALRARDGQLVVETNFSDIARFVEVEAELFVK